MFISVKEAMELTGMSSTSIYRLCNKRINTLYIRKEDNKFLIDKDFILATYPPDIVKATEESDVETNPIIREPEFEVVQTNNSQSDIQFIMDDDISDVDEISLSSDSSSNDDEILLISLSQKSQIETNVIGNKNVDIEQIAVATVEEKTQNEISVPIKYFNWETVIGIAVSLVIAGTLIFLIYREVS